MSAVMQKEEALHRLRMAVFNAMALLGEHVVRAIITTAIDEWKEENAK